MLPLVCIDVDGTLVGSSGSPSEAVWAAAEAAVARGQRLAICTARPALGVTVGYADRLDAAGWHIFHNGAALVRPSDGGTVEHSLEPAAIGACAALAAAQGWALEHYVAADFATDDDGDLARRHAALLGVTHRRRRPSSLAGAVVRVQFVVPLGDADRVLAGVPGSCAASFATSPVMPDAAFVSVTAAGVTKAGAVAELAALVGAPLDRVMMVGDGRNDVAAMTVVGHGVAMGNAEPACLAAARHVVGHVDDDGLVEALALSADL